MRNVFIGLVVSLIVISTLLALADRPRSFAETASSDSGVSRKLDEILDNQKAILRAVASIKEELQIIKMRITSR